MTADPAFPYLPERMLPPGETLSEVLEERGMTQAELALRTGLSTKHVNQIVKGQAAVSAETAVLLERATGVSAAVWLNLESLYQVDRSLQGEAERMTGDFEWLKKVPTAELQKRGYVKKSSDRVQLLREVLNFFGVANQQTWVALWEKPTAYRRSRAFASDPLATAAWLRIGEIKAASIETTPFDKSLLQDCLPSLRELTRVADPNVWQPQLNEILAAAGVAVVLEPEISGARVVGATRWLTPTRALIQLSLRHRWSDILWFTVFHEVGHLLLHSKKDVFINDPGPHSGAEAEADAFASRTLIPREHEARLAYLTTEAEVRLFADELGVGPDIVVGRLQHDQRWPHSKGNSLRRRYQFS